LAWVTSPLFPWPTVFMFPFELHKEFTKINACDSLVCINLRWTFKRSLSRSNATDNHRPCTFRKSQDDVWFHQGGSHFQTKRFSSAQSLTLSGPSFAIFPPLLRGSATCCPINHAEKILINHKHSAINQAVRSGVTGQPRRSQRSSMGCERGRGCVASLILGRCQKGDR